ncbi:MAG: hypothetical protein ACWA41_04320 [Putridiphycobacter sp.]
MKNILSFLFISFLFISAKAENTYPVKFGPVEKGSRYSGIRILGKSNQNLIVYRLNLRNELILNFNAALAQNLETKIDLSFGKNAVRKFEAISLFNDKIFVFSSYRDKKTKIKTLFYEIYDAKSLIRKKEAKEIVSYDASSNKLFGSKGGFDVYFSEDEQFFGVIINLPYDKNDFEKFKAVVFDNDLNEVISEEYQLPIMDSKMRMGSAYLSNTGEFYIGAQEYTGEKKIFQPATVINHIYHLAEEGELIDNKVQLKNKYIYSYTFKTNEYDDLILSGFYTLEGRTGVVGTFYLRIDAKTNEVDFESSDEFSENFITQGWSDRSKKKASKKNRTPKLYNYRIRQLLTTEDGGALLVAEQYYSVTRTYTTSNGATRTVTYYYYNDVIISRLDEEGNFKWNKKVRKYQVSTNDGGYYSSFAFHHYKDNIYIMYNDNIKNYDENGNAILDESKIAATNFSSNKKNVTSMVTINIESGELAKEQVFNKKETGTIAVPKIHFSSKSDNKLYFYTKKGKKERLGQISF